MIRIELRLPNETRTLCEFATREEAEIFLATRRAWREHLVLIDDSEQTQPAPPVDEAAASPAKAP
jgi:hypothetical protein